MLIQRTEKLFKVNGTPVIVKFGLANQLVLLKIADWQQEPKYMRTEQINSKSLNSEIYELILQHGYRCECCNPVIRESYTHPTTEEAARERSLGRRRMGIQRRGI